MIKRGIDWRTYETLITQKNATGVATDKPAPTKQKNVATYPMEDVS